MDEKNFVKVSSLGAKISVALNGVLVLSSYTRGDGKQGETHPCTPIFGPDRKNIYGLSQHGNMRNEECLISQDGDTYFVSHIITDPGYPGGMKVEQVLNVNAGIFSFEMTHTNTGQENAYLNAGEHCYFDAPQGFEGTKVNGQDISDLIKNNYDGFAIDLQKTNSISIPGKPEYTLEQTGFKKAVVWVGKNPETKEIDKNYVCIEPVEDDPFGDYFGSPQSIIAPASQRVTKFQLRVV